MKLLRGTKVELDQEYLHVTLADGSIISTPLPWYEELTHATEDQRHHYKFLGKGLVIEWPDLDFHLDVQEMMRVEIQEKVA